MKMSYQQIKQQFLPILLGFCLFIFSGLLMAASEEDKAIEAPVLELHNALLKIMESAGSTSFEDRYAVIEPVIKSRFDTPLISKVVLSRYWKTLDEKTQNEFIDRFDRLTISTYVDRFNSYNGETFKTVSIEPMKKNRFLVKTELASPGEDTVSLDYIVQKDKEQWKIISVIADGINDLSLKRAEYSAVIRDKGYDALVADIEGKISNLHP